MTNLQKQKLIEKIEKRLARVDYNNHEELLSQCEQEIEKLKNKGVNVTELEQEVNSLWAQHETDLPDDYDPDAEDGEFPDD